MFDVIAFLDDYSIDYATSGANISKNFIGIQCPECGKSEGYHLGISSDGSFASCWVCGGKSIPYLIQLLLSCSKAEALKIIDEYQGYTKGSLVTADTKTIYTVKHIDLPGKELAKPHRRYLEGRGFDPDVLAKKYGLLGTGMAAWYEDQDFSYSIIIPVFDRARNVISFQGRDYTGKKELRYKGLKLEYSVRHYKETLYNLNNAKSDTVVMVEGVVDCWALGDDSVASFGTSMKPSQLRELKDYRKVFVLFDDEVEAQRKAMGYCRDLSCMGIDVENVSLGLGTRDVGDLDENEIIELRSELGIL